MTTWKSDFEHGSCKNSGNRSFDFDRLLLTALFCVAIALIDTTTAATATSAAASSEISWSSDNLVDLGFFERQKSPPGLCDLKTLLAMEKS